MAELKKLHITVGKKELMLSPEEAKELKAILEDLFGKKEEPHWHTIEEARDVWLYKRWCEPFWGTGAGLVGDNISISDNTAL